jgi:hypothetical protein
LAEFGGKGPFTVGDVTVDPEDITLVRKVRAEFVREHCRASFVGIPRPEGIRTNGEFRSYLEQNYEIPIKRQLSLPWQGKKASSVVVYDTELKGLAWEFLRKLSLTDAELRVFSKMEKLFGGRGH